MRALLTGVNGQIGWELARALEPLPVEVLAFGREEMNLAESGAVRDTIRRARPDVIINTAAYTDVDGAEREKGLAMAVNGVAPGVMAEEAGGIGASVIHLSTDYVFDGAKDEPYTENDPANPVNEYGRSKLAGERAVASAGAPYIILRTSWVYGLRGDNFLLKILKLSRERDEIAVVDDQRGTPTWSRLVAGAVARIVELHGADLAGVAGVYHVACAGSATRYEFARAIIERAVEEGRRPRIVPALSSERPAPARRPRYSALSCGKLKETFGIALPPWETALDMCLEDRPTP